MKEKLLEDYIIENRDQFDVNFPSENIWLKIYLAGKKLKLKRFEQQTNKIQEQR